MLLNSLSVPKSSFTPGAKDIGGIPITFTLSPRRNLLLAIGFLTRELSAAVPQSHPTPPTPARIPPDPHRSASQTELSTSPYPAPKFLSRATGRTTPPRFSLLLRNQKSRYSFSPSLDRSSNPASPQFLSLAAARSHDPHAAASAIPPEQSTPLPQLPPPAASLRQTSSGKSAPSQ